MISSCQVTDYWSLHLVDFDWLKLYESAVGFDWSPKSQNLTGWPLPVGYRWTTRLVSPTNLIIRLVWMRLNYSTLFYTLRCSDIITTEVSFVRCYRVIKHRTWLWFLSNIEILLPQRFNGAFVECDCSENISKVNQSIDKLSCMIFYNQLGDLVFGHTWPVTWLWLKIGSNILPGGHRT